MLGYILHNVMIVHTHLEPEIEDRAVVEWGYRRGCGTFYSGSPNAIDHKLLLRCVCMKVTVV